MYASIVSSTRATQSIVLLSLGTTAAVTLGADKLCAELIIDDFDVPAMLRGPEDIDIFTEPQAVGDLDLLRRLQFGTVGPDSVGRFDSNISAPSQLTAILENPAITLPGFNQIEHRLLYALDFDEYASFDLSEGGRNDAFILDFQRLEGTRPPDQIRMYVSAHGTTFEYREVNLPLSSEPFSIVIPFDEFHLRGGGPPPPSPAFTDVGLIDMSFLSGILAAPYELALERIRVGSTTPIPEPGTIWMALAAVLFTLCIAGRVAPGSTDRPLSHGNRALFPGASF